MRKEFFGGKKYFQQELHKGLDDFIERNRRVNIIKPKISILGERHRETIVLRPPPGEIKARGYDFYLSLENFYNERYWILKLWLSMFEDANYKIPKNIVKAFIRNCFYTTAEDIIKSGKLHIDKNDIESAFLSKEVDFYKRAFNVAAVISEMNQKPFVQLQSLTYRNRKYKMSSKVSTAQLYSKKELIIALFREHGLEKYIEVIDACYNVEEKEPISDILDTMLFYFKFAFGRNKLHRELRNALSTK